MKSLPVILTMVCLLFSLSATGLFVYTQVFYKKIPPNDKVEFEKMKEEGVSDGLNPIEGFKIKKLVINLELESSNEKLRFLNIEAILMPFKSKQFQTLEDNQPLINDTFIVVASHMNADELNSISGKILLENKVRKALNEKLGEDIVKEILFQQFIIQ